MKGIAKMLIGLSGLGLDVPYQTAAGPKVADVQPYPPHCGSVSGLQQMLKDIGFDPGPVDGMFGTKTTQALVGYAQSRGLTAAAGMTQQICEALMAEWQGAAPGSAVAAGTQAQPTTPSAPILSAIPRPLMSTLKKSVAWMAPAVSTYRGTPDGAAVDAARESIGDKIGSLPTPVKLAGAAVILGVVGYTVYSLV
jgi:peptidoglycan hydrolase-like protein with peptidoglycan-binding domain